MLFPRITGQHTVYSHSPPSQRRLPSFPPKYNPAPGFVPYGPNPQYLGGAVQLVPDEWEAALSSYPDTSFPNILLRVIWHGATLGVFDDIGPVFQTTSRPVELTFLRNEVKRRLDRHEVCIVDKSFPMAVCALAAVPKERTKLRAIHDLRPVNLGVPKASGTLQYSTLQDLFNVLPTAPRGQLLWKADLSNAFRHIRLSATASRQAGFELDGMSTSTNVSPLVLELPLSSLTFLPKPCIGSYSNVAFHTFSTTLTTSFSADTYESANHIMETFHKVTSSLGIAVNKEKCIRPATCAIILGIEVGTVSMEARLDLTRRNCMSADLSTLLTRRTGSCFELEQITGLLQFATQVIPLGRVFLHLYKTIGSFPEGTARRCIPKLALSDLSWWRDLLRDRNGIHLLQPPPATTFHVWTDASGLFGAGGHVGPVGQVTSAFAFSFPPRHRFMDILFKELHAVLHAARLGRTFQWPRAHVIFHIDNQAVVEGVRSGSLRMGSAQTLLHALWLEAALLPFTFSSVWVSSEQNNLADAFSRFDFCRAHSIGPAATQVISLKLDPLSIPPPHPQSLQSSATLSPSCPTRQPVSCTQVLPNQLAMATSRLNAATPPFVPASNASVSLPQLPSSPTGRHISQLFRVQDPDRSVTPLLDCNRSTPVLVSATLLLTPPSSPECFEVSGAPLAIRSDALGSPSLFPSSTKF